MLLESKNFGTLDAQALGIRTENVQSDSLSDEGESDDMVKKEDDVLERARGRKGVGELDATEAKHDLLNDSQTRLMILT